MQRKTLESCLIKLSRYNAIVKLSLTYHETENTLVPLVRASSDLKPFQAIPNCIEALREDQKRFRSESFNSPKK